MSHNVHQDGGHVDGHENTQKSSAKDDLGISLKWWKEAKKTHKSVILGQDFKFVDILGFQGFLSMLYIFCLMNKVKDYLLRACQ